MSDDYAKRQAERDRKYRESFQSPEAREWLAKLPHEERRKLETDGLLAPMLPKDGTANGCGIEDDAADSPCASVDAPRISAADSLDAIIADYPHLEAAIEERARKINGGGSRGDVLASFCARMRGCANPVLVFDAICYATGVSSLEGQSGVELAAKHGVTKQAFSKIAVEWCTKFGLPPARSMKSRRARESYRERAKKVHSRHRARLNRNKLTAGTST